MLLLILKNCIQLWHINMTANEERFRTCKCVHVAVRQWQDKYLDF